MTQHNIVGTEAHRPIAHVQIAHGRRRGQPLPWRGFAVVAAIGVSAGLIDSLVSGKPVLLVGVVALALWLLLWDR